MSQPIDDTVPARVETEVEHPQATHDNMTLPENIENRFDAVRFHRRCPSNEHIGYFILEPSNPSCEPSDEVLIVPSPPLDDEEQKWFRLGFDAYRAGDRFDQEAQAMRKRIFDRFGQRDCSGRYTYRGPNLAGKLGSKRLDVMIRNCIRKRWEKLHVWNPAWGIPGRLNPELKDRRDLWQWEWDPTIDPSTNNGPVTQRQSDVTWPARNEERADECAVRQFLKNEGPQNHLSRMLSLRWNQCSNFDAGHREHLITTRPWFRFNLEVSDAEIKLSRFRDFSTASTEAVKITKDRWHVAGQWNDSWHETPGWKWRNESPSPEPEDFNDLDFSPSEIDALELVDLDESTTVQPVQGPPPAPNPNVLNLSARCLVEVDHESEAMTLQMGILPADAAQALHGDLSAESSLSDVTSERSTAKRRRIIGGDFSGPINDAHRQAGQAFTLK